MNRRAPSIWQIRSYPIVGIIELRLENLRKSSFLKRFFH